uniref:Rab proteins geranylgeranyltransferase component n=1 Tax=Oryza barthii TaxID=65489 RepID=A0A0D3HBC2_9ORYZ
MAEAPAHDYPTIEPTSFDVVICGTGLPESVLAAACAAAGKTVLHVDPNPFYGSLYSSVPLPSFLSPDPSSVPLSPSGDDSHTVVDLHRRNIYSEVETSGAAPEPSRRFTVDLVGPRVLYCADEAVGLLLRSGGSHHVEFKSVEGGSLLYWEGQLYPVPDSRQAIFNDTATLKLTEKTVLFRFFELVRAHIAAADEDGEGEEASDKISEEDLDLPFVEYLKKHRLPPKLRAVVLYAIAMADYDQDTDCCEKLLTTREGIQTIALYSSSIGRFANAQGAFIYPMYGHGELPQAFCRCAAVKGALYVLRMPISALLMDEERKNFLGARLTSGQDILCQQLILDPSYKVPILDASSDGSDSNLLRKVARGICIISKSVKQDSSNLLIVFPPKSLEEQQIAAIRGLQLSSNLAASDSLEGHLEETSENNEDLKPTVIWSCVYVQEITEGTSSSLLSCPTPDEHLDYRSILDSSKKLFADIYPNEEFLPKKSAAVYANDDSDSADNFHVPNVNEGIIICLRCAF